MPNANDDASVGPSAENRISSILSVVETSDFERFEPPADLWNRIGAAIAADNDSPQAGSGSVVEYSIDSDDVVFTVDRDWDVFAEENGGTELGELNPTRTLWSYFDGEEVRDLWRLLVEKVRTKQTPATVPLRCDAPDMRRWLEMTITPDTNGVVHFRSHVVFEEARENVTLFGAAANDDTPEVSLCSWCGNGLHDGRWFEIEELARTLRLLESSAPSISQGICPTCRELMSSEMDLLEQSHGG